MPYKMLSLLRLSYKKDNGNRRAGLPLRDEGPVIHRLPILHLQIRHPLYLLLPLASPPQSVECHMGLCYRYLSVLKRSRGTSGLR